MVLALPCSAHRLQSSLYSRTTYPRSSRTHRSRRSELAGVSWGGLGRWCCRSGRVVARVAIIERAAEPTSWVEETAGMGSKGSQGHPRCLGGCRAG